jgi:polyisoprenyl-phosphate glycosyltransferase
MTMKRDIHPRVTPPVLSVVLSFRNEECVLPELVRRLRTVLRAQTDEGEIAAYELVFVDDASTDNSRAVLERLALENDIVLVELSRNFGPSEGVMAGLAQTRGDAVIYMDSDLQDPPEVIPELLKRWRSDSEVEVVYTTRRSRSGEHPLKLLLTKVGYRLINSISEIELPLDSGDFKLLSRRVVDELLLLEEKKPYVRGLVSWVGFKQEQVHYDRDPRYDGAHMTKCPVFSRKVLDGYFDRALISFSDVPLKISLLLGFSVSAVALVYILVVLFQKAMGWHVPGWPAIMAAVLLLGGIILMVLGFLGLYINIIFLETKRRPNYIVKRVRQPEDFPGPREPRDTRQP